MIRRSKRWRGVRDDKEQLELVEFQPGTIYKYYYTLEESDPGVMMETNLATKEVIEMEIMNLHVFLRMMEKAIMETNKFERFLYLQLFVISFLTCVEQFQIKVITKLLKSIDITYDYAYKRHNVTKKWRRKFVIKKLFSISNRGGDFAPHAKHY